MEFWQILARIMDEKRLTVADVAKASGLTDSTVRSIIDRKQQKVALSVAFKLSDGLGVSLERLNGMEEPKKAPPDISDEVQQLIEDYEGLDQPGKNVVRVVVAEEKKRVDAARELREVTASVPSKTRYIPQYFTPSAAGMTSPAEGEDFDYIEVGDDVPWNADFAVKIDGESMEPYIRDGSTVYVTRQPLQNGDVGIWCCNGDMICKQYFKDRNNNVHLLSLNRDCKYADRFIAEDDTDTVLAYYGRVILPRRPGISLL